MADDFATNSGDDVEMRDGRIDAWYVLAMRGAVLEGGLCRI